MVEDDGKALTKSQQLMPTGDKASLASLYQGVLTTYGRSGSFHHEANDRGRASTWSLRGVISEHVALRGMPSCQGPGQKTGREDHEITPPSRPARRHCGHSRLTSCRLQHCAVLAHEPGSANRATWLWQGRKTGAHWAHWRGDRKIHLSSEFHGPRARPGAIMRQSGRSVRSVAEARACFG